MNLTTTGTILGVRANEANKRTGELSKFCTIDLYDAEDGPAEIRCPLDVKLPAPGTLVQVKIKVSAYSGFVRESEKGATVGDARIQYTAVEVTPVGSESSAKSKSTAAS